MKDTFCEGDPYASLIRAAQNHQIVIYDTETTGLDIGKDQIVQIAAIKIDAGGNITDKMDTYVIPTIPITKGALATHHIMKRKNVFRFNLFQSVSSEKALISSISCAE